MNINQEQANEIMEDPVLNLGKSYGDVLRIFYFTMLYSSFAPYCVFIGIFQMFCCYWIDKYNIFYRRSVKDSLNQKLTQHMIDLGELGLFIYISGVCFFQFRLFQCINYTNIGLLVLSIILFYTPTFKIMAYFNCKGEQETDNSVYEMNFEDAQKEFMTVILSILFQDYHIENPVSRNIYLNQWRSNFHRKMNLKLQRINSNHF